MTAVVHIQVTGIQDFIFRSRTLIDTIGRSSQIEQLTSPGFTGIAQHSEVTVLFAAAGRISVRIDRASPENCTLVHDFVASYTRVLAEVSDALTPVVHIEFCTSDDEIAAAVVNAPRALQPARHRTLPSLAGEAPWGTIMCPVTGVGAEGLDADGEPCAREVEQSGEAGKRFHQLQTDQLLAGIPEPLRSLLSLPRQTDQLGRSHGKSSHVAVIVADLRRIDLGRPVPDPRWHRPGTDHRQYRSASRDLRHRRRVDRHGGR
ncbi:hypothetical protein [Nocardia salmonicida]|uniref:hypothetical protein n=1 Tax=Nocardia salmonicida TaxID=53431 RepID=UPI003CEB1DB4